ncbi:hypothetical protein R0J90_03710 [Micrococcus sp. SIMBA_144]
MGTHPRRATTTAPPPTPVGAPSSYPGPGGRPRAGAATTCANSETPTASRALARTPG